MSSPRTTLRLRLVTFAAALVAIALGGCAFAQPLPYPASPPARAPIFEGPVIGLKTVATGLESPWSLAFLPDGRMLVTELPGRMRIVSAAGVVGPPLRGLPAIRYGGQGGLFDVVLSPQFARDRTIFFSFAQPVEAQTSRTAVARARLDDTGLSDVRIIFAQNRDLGGGAHFGSRLVFGDDGNLWVTLGDRYSQRAAAQDLSSHFGKVVRIRPDGSVPPDNPFVGRPGALPEIWSYGHRNVQGAFRHPQTGQLWTHEHGARGGDELNLDLPGRNYGWPVISWGIDYSGAAIGEGGRKDGMEQPLHHWVPSIAPSGMAYYDGARFPHWRGSVLVGALAGRGLVRLQMRDTHVVLEERLLPDLDERIRDVRVDAQGDVYVVTDARPGRILKLVPPEGSR